MKRGLALVLALALAAPASAQVLGLGESLPGSYRPGSVSVVNTATAGVIYSVSVPAKLFGQFKGTTRGASRLHVGLLGYLSTHETTDSVGRVNLGCNYGGANATLALLNAFTWPKGLSSVPMRIDLWLASNSGSNGQILFAQLATGQNTNSTATRNEQNIIMALVVGTVDMNVNQTLTCSWQWASAAALNGVTISNGITVVGD